MNLGLDFPNLPYLIHGELKLTESQNVVNYVIDITKSPQLQGEGRTRFLIDNVRFMGDELMGKIFQATRKQGEERQKEFDGVIIPKIACL